MLITWSVAALYFYRPLSDFGKNKDNLTINNIVEYLDFLTIQTVERPASQYDPVLRIISFVHHKTLIADIPPPVAASEYTQFNQSVSTYQAGSIRPDIMMVLVESAFDPTLVGTCIDQSCTRYGYMSGFSGRNEQNPMLVHTVGGRTWLSEFAFFTGFDYRFFRASGVLAPLVLAPELKKSLVTHLKQIGYRTVAIYAIDGNFLDARKIYEHYGIDEFYSLSELRRLGDDQGDSRAMTFANWEKVTDREVYSHALDISKTKDDGRPLFLFVLTIRNHSPWQGAFSLDLAKVLNGSTPNPPLDDYTAKLKDTDTDFASLINTWFSSDRPRVLGWFGDHQPHTTTQPPLPGHTLDARIAEQYRKYPQYFTFYGLFANYPVEVTDKDPQMLDIAFLGQRMLKFAGLPLPDDLIGADRVIEACSGALYDCPDKKLINAYVAKRIYVDGVLKTD